MSKLEAVLAGQLMPRTADTARLVAQVHDLGKRALAMMLKAKLVNGEDPCPGCRSRWTGNGVHLAGCEWTSIMAALKALG